MTIEPDFQIPDDLDEAADWLSDAIRDPALRRQFNASPRTLVLFIEKAAQILSALAERDGELRLSNLLTEVASKVRKQSLS